MPRRPSPLPFGMREVPRLLSEADARALSAEFGFHADYDLHHDLDWRLAAFDFFRHRPPVSPRRRRQLLELFLAECRRVLRGDRSRERALVERIAATPGLPPSDLLECQAASGVALDVTSVRQYQVWAEEAKERLERRPAAPVGIGVKIELFLLWQLQLVWRAGTGSAPSVSVNPYANQPSEEYRGAFLDFAERVLALLGVSRSAGGVYQALKRLKKTAGNNPGE